MSNTDFIIIALDCNSEIEAKQFIDDIPQATFFKVGMELFFSAGPGILKYLKIKNKKIFLDLKLNDIPATLEKAAKVLSRFEPDLFTVFCGPEGVASVKKGIGPNTKVLNVSVLTSQDDFNKDDLRRQVLSRGTMTRASGGDGVICSGLETALVRKTFGADFLIVNPGIRPSGASNDDQRRVVTPQEAMLAGANHIVIGRSITRSNDPSATFNSIFKSIG